MPIARGLKRKNKTVLKKKSKKDSSKLRKTDKEEISSEDDFSGDGKNYSEHSEDDYEEPEVTIHEQAKKLLSDLAKTPAQAEESDSESNDDDDIEIDTIARPLKHKDQLRKETEHKKVAGLVFIDDDSVFHFRPHRLSPTCIAVSSNGKFVVSCSKDGAVVKFDVETRKKCGQLFFDKKKLKPKFHTGNVLCAAISPDNKYLVTGGVDKLIKVWNFETLDHVKDFSGHRGAVTSLVFRHNYSGQLFSSSRDRSIKAWSLDEMGFVDTMYGHQDIIPQLDMLSRNRVLSCGAQDRTVRLFKIAEESHLVFNGYAGAVSIDTIAMINEDHFVSGSIDGSIYVWSVFKKKPVYVQKLAHDRNETTKEVNWICSVAALKYSDLIASGSCDGVLRLWKVSPDYKSLDVVEEFELDGFINDIRFTEDGQKLICAVGQEHKNGRWWKIDEANNAIVVLPLKYRLS